MDMIPYFGWPLEAHNTFIKPNFGGHFIHLLLMWIRHPSPGGFLIMYLVNLGGFKINLLT